MATKKQKREIAEKKRAAFDAEVKASGLAAQKADHVRDEARQEALREITSQMKQRARTTLLSNGINPSTGKPFTDDELRVMEQKANTPERMALYNKIVAGRAALLDEQPPLNMSDYSAEADTYGFGGMTVGDFRERMDGYYKSMGWGI